MSKPETLREDLLEAFIRLIAQRTGLVVKDIDQAPLNMQILSRMRSSNLASAENYYQLLESETAKSQTEWQQLIALLTNNESYFFRDRPQLNVIQNHLLPELIQRKQRTKSLRICSAGCSTGEEPYSLAIILKQLLPDLPQWNLLVLGIDIDEEVLNKARTGIYSAWSFRGVEPQIKQRYFKRINNRYSLLDEIKQMVQFKKVNLVQDAFPQFNSELKDIDLFICRNVFIYFQSAAIARVLEKVYYTLQPNGYLITGHTELSHQTLTGFKPHVFPDTVVYQHVNKSLVKTAQTKSSSALPTHQSSPTSSASVQGTKNNFLPETNQKESKINLVDSLNKIQAILAQSIDQPLMPIKVNQADKQQNISDEENKSKADLATTIEAAKALWQQKQHQPALQKLETVLKEDELKVPPENASAALPCKLNFAAYELMAQVQADLGRYTEAEKSCEKAIAIDAFAPYPHYLLAQIAESQKNISEAKRILRQVIYLDPNFVGAYLDLGQIYHQEGEKQRAIKMQQAALDLLKQLPGGQTIPERDNITASQLITQLSSKM